MRQQQFGGASFLSRFELMKQLQTKLTTVGRTDDRLDTQINQLEALVAADDANRPKVKRASFRFARPIGAI